MAATALVLGGEGGRQLRRALQGWSALMGFGQPPRESFSPLVIGILAAALGTPAVLLLVGSLAVLARQRKPCSEYKPIN